MMPGFRRRFNGGLPSPKRSRFGFAQAGGARLPRVASAHRRAHKTSASLYRLIN
jgi:hypothetical protein